MDDEIAVALLSPSAAGSPPLPLVCSDRPVFPCGRRAARAGGLPQRRPRLPRTAQAGTARSCAIQERRSRQRPVEGGRAARQGRPRHLVKDFPRSRPRPARRRRLGQQPGPSPGPRAHRRKPYPNACRGQRLLSAFRFRRHLLPPTHEQQRAVPARATRWLQPVVEWIERRHRRHRRRGALPHPAAAHAHLRRFSHPRGPELGGGPLRPRPPQLCGCPRPASGGRSGLPQHGADRHGQRGERVFQSPCDGHGSHRHRTHHQESAGRPGHRAGAPPGGSDRRTGRGARQGRTLPATRPTSPWCDRTRAELENALATLVGQPASTFRFAKHDLGRGTPPRGCPPACPRPLLERRPDVAEAERELASANEQHRRGRRRVLPTHHRHRRGGFRERHGARRDQSRQHDLVDRTERDACPSSRAGATRRTCAKQRAHATIRASRVIAARCSWLSRTWRTPWATCATSPSRPRRRAVPSRRPDAPCNSARTSTARGR